MRVGAVAIFRVACEFLHGMPCRTAAAPDSAVTSRGGRCRRPGMQCDHRDAGVVDARLASDRGLRHRGHTHEVGAVALQTANLGGRFQPRPLGDPIGSAVPDRYARGLGGGQHECCLGLELGRLAPLVPAADAVEVDSTTMTIDEVTALVMQEIEKVFALQPESWS